MDVVVAFAGFNVINYIHIAKKRVCDLLPDCCFEGGGGLVGSIELN